MKTIENKSFNMLPALKKENIKKESFFKNNYTNVAKGLAVLFLLFHHLGIDSELNLFNQTGPLFLCASEFKICVDIFVFLSGYGLNASYNKKCDGKILGSIKFSIKHLLKLMFNFWIIFILFVSFGSITGLEPLNVYAGGVERNIIKPLLIDFFGLANLLNSPTYNVTWWFMSLIIVLYIIFPILKYLLKKSPIFLAILAIFIRNATFLYFNNQLNIYLVDFCMGMIFSELLLFDKIRNLNKTKVQEIILTIIFFLFALYSKYIYGGIYYFIDALAYVLICNNILMRIKFVNKGLELLGKHSSNIFMLHTFLYKYFFFSYFVKLKYWIIMFIVLVILSLVISIIIEESKKICKNIYLKIKKEERIR